VAVLISPELQRELFSPEALERLHSLAHVYSFDRDASEAEQFSQLVRQADVCLTGWETPAFSGALLAQAPSLRLLAHTGGSVHFLNASALLTRGIRISHANAALAEGVAEFTVMQALLCVRQAWIFDHLLKKGKLWERAPSKLLRTQCVGIVSLGSIGREVIARLRPFGCPLIAYDPYLTPDTTARLGVEMTDLETLFARADIVSIHTPLLPETRGMIGASHLSLLHDGAILLNTARGGIVDEEALLRELTSGRLLAALDVFHQEPLDQASPLRSLPNVFLSPHIAALTIDTLLMQGQMMVDEIQRFVLGEPLQYEVTPEKLATMA
jgi:phosphoglycerate dehydrogenase-like enzyme